MLFAVDFFLIKDHICHNVTHFLKSTETKSKYIKKHIVYQYIIKVPVYHMISEHVCFVKGSLSKIDTDFACVFTSHIYYNLSETKRIHRDDF